ncbi:MAG TPA: LytTR family DNA-binding domain-containing protein [Caulobacteraceae bacterium]|nr:LytTR family DNA-binding domain-containing protein [Caulobacteraceae bacterium]
MREPTPQLRQPPPPAVRASWGDVNDWRIVAASMAVGAFLAFAAAFDTGGIPLITRLGYWMGLMGVGALIGTAIGHFLTPRAWLGRRPIAAGLMIGASISLPMSVVVAGVSALLNHRPFDLRFAAIVFPSVLVVSLGMTAISFLLQRRPTATHAAPAGAPPPKFLERLPLKLRGAEVWAVEAEDHYLRLHTSKGQDLILMRLSDAVRELEGIEGAQTHRSWWVAREAVTEVERGDGRATLTLKGGTMVPVSRAYARSLREEGWF